MANLQGTNLTGSVFGKIGTSSVSGTTVTVDLATGSYFVLDLQGASGTITTFTVSNVNASTPYAITFTTKVIQGSTARQFNWGGLSAFKSVAGNYAGFIEITTGNDIVDVLSFISYDNGTTWNVSVYGQDIGQVGD